MTDNLRFVLCITPVIGLLWLALWLMGCPTQ